jgi:crotonobetainyl-CoA:carnitine CoA-transferase CaiB-like acyl-CoA transferase
VRPGIPVTDLMTGYGAVKAVLAGIIGRNKNGKGMYIDVAMFDVQVD